MGHENRVESFGWTENAETLITACKSYQGQTGVCVWDTKSGKLLRTIPDGGEVSPDGRLVAWQGQSVIRLREMEKGQVVCTMLSKKGHGGLGSGARARHLVHRPPGSGWGANQSGDKAPHSKTRTRKGRATLGAPP
ncbi:MAG TPA: hypothetical protein PLF81_13925, partial [Candidatus Anammoximicrobium sp.]|nr:hypothetical protein [Candidatus Anammoximicrobium sp.]